jgi:hypothetical protein
MANDVLNPSPQLLITLGSALVHAQEFFEPGGHPVDKDTFITLMQHPDVVEWIDGMNELALLPKKRSTDGK